MANSIIQLRNIKKSFGTRIVSEVLHGVDLTLNQGEIAALVGPSGSGKSTLLNIVGLLEKPTSGEFLFLGHDVLAIRDPALTLFRGKNIGFIFQFHHLLPAYTAVENVMMPLAAIKGRFDSDMKNVATETLIELGLGDKLQQLPSELSGGQQQRVSIARAIVGKPPLILADEPTGNLDSKSADATFSALSSLCDKKGLTVLIVTHDRNIAKRCQRTMEMVDGRMT